MWEDSLHMWLCCWLWTILQDAFLIQQVTLCAVRDQVRKPLPFSVILLRCPSVSSPFMCWAFDHFHVAWQFRQRVGSREETKAKFTQINCIVCRPQQVCCLHWQHCRFVCFFILLPQNHTPKFLLPLCELFQQMLRQFSGPQHEPSLQKRIEGVL